MNLDDFFTVVWAMRYAIGVVAAMVIVILWWELRLSSDESEHDRDERGEFGIFEVLMCVILAPPMIYVAYLFVSVVFGGDSASQYG